MLRWLLCSCEGDGEEGTDMSREALLVSSVKATRRCDGGSEAIIRERFVIAGLSEPLPEGAVQAAAGVRRVECSSS